MQTIKVTGGIPLKGTVKTSGAKNAALKLITAAMFSNEDVILENVPRIKNLDVDLEIIEAMGGSYTWIEKHKLVLNGSGINTYKIPYELGSKYRTSILLAAPLLYRFGKASLPLPGGCKIGYRPINRWIETWRSLGINVVEDDKYVHLDAQLPIGTDLTFKIISVMGTENAILTALFAKGETIITGAAEESEIDDLIKLCNLMGGSVERTGPNQIKVDGKQVFNGACIKVQPDKIEVATFVIAAIVTGGNITIKGVQKPGLLSFMSALSKMGVHFEFSKESLRVWHSGEDFTATNISTAPAPGFATDWQPLITILLTQAVGESLVHDTIYTDRFGYVKDLVKMGANIKLLTPSEAGLDLEISDDSYDLKALGEPKTVAKVIGPTKLKGASMVIPDLRAGAALVIAALAANGQSSLTGYEHVVRGYEDFAEKLTSLGAQIEVIN